MRRSSLPGLLALLALAALVAAALVVGARVLLDLRDARGAAPPALGEAPDEPDAAERGRVPPSLPADAEPATVDRVVDGDTIRISGGDDAASERVRLLNIDAPELDHPERGRECGARTATAMVEDLLPPGSLVWLAGDREDRDRYDRLLRYAWTEEGVDVQAALVEAGLAELLVIAPNDRFADQLRPLEDAARRQGSGMWGQRCLD